jgi:hypothetical protein
MTARAARIAWSVAVAAALLASPGCAHFGKRARRAPKSQAAQAEQASKPHLIGTVAFVDESAGFVLVNVGMLVPPMPGQALKSFTGDKESAVLSVSAERRPPFVVADIVKGEPHKGDAVLE